MYYELRYVHVHYNVRALARINIIIDLAGQRI